MRAFLQTPVRKWGPASPPAPPAAGQRCAFLEPYADPCSIPDTWYADIFDDRYLAVDQLRNPPDVTLSEVSWLHQVADLSRPRRILDLCCGYGRHAIQLARQGHSVLGVDLSSTMLNMAERCAATARVSIDFRLQDARAAIDEQFDVVLSMHTSLGYLPTPDDNYSLIRHIRRLLAPRGRFIFCQLNPQSQSARRRQYIERHSLPNGLQYRKVSRFCLRRNLWYGYYEYTDRAATTALPFRIYLLPDASGCYSGAYEFRSDAH
ncbi:MAG: class I SAM-dependent methyltransferase [Phycisphaerae bacterium]|nr:class I SAM-dependent methyltransferase [Phycisphaerae bacterium]